VNEIKLQLSARLPQTGLHPKSKAASNKAKSIRVEGEYIL